MCEKVRLRSWATPMMDCLMQPGDLVSKFCLLYQEKIYKHLFLSSQCIFRRCISEKASKLAQHVGS